MGQCLFFGFHYNVIIMKVVILEPYLRGGLMELEWCGYKLVRPMELKTWIPTVLGLKFMGFLADLNFFHFEGQEIVSKLGSPIFPL